MKTNFTSTVAPFGFFGSRHQMPYEIARRDFVGGQPNTETFWSILDKPHIGVVVIRKSKEKWLASVDRFSADLRGHRPGLYETGRLDLDGAAQLHDEFHREWKKIESPRIMKIGYVETLEDTAGFLNEIKQRFDLHRRLDGEWALRLGPPFTPERRAYYLEK